MTVDQNKRIVREAFEALMANDLGPLDGLLAHNAVLHQCGFLEPIRKYAILQGIFPGPRRLADREVRLERIIGEGDIVALHWRTSGRFTDPDSPERDGKPVSFPSMSFIRMKDGKIAEIWNIQDVSTMHTQLGEPPKPVASR
ncbi:MAG TPA: nuclear transport factor 2 family protein [Chloroflexota bacterium]